MLPLAVLPLVAGLATAAPTSTAANAGTGRFSIAQTPGYEHPVLSVARTYRKYGKPLPPALVEGVRNVTASMKRSTGSAPTNSWADSVAHKVRVSLGTPAQEFDLLLDSGSSDFWIFGPDPRGINCEIYHCFHPENSTTAKLKEGYTWSIHYVDGTGYEGIVYDEVAKIGGLTIENQAIGVQVTEDTSLSLDIGGIVGLGFGKINTIKPVKQKTWFENIQSSLDAPLFTVDLYREKEGTYNFGFIDESLYTGDIAYSDVDSSRGFWEITSSGWGINDEFNSENWKAIVDTGTSLNYLPEDVANAWYDSIPGKTYSFLGIKVFDCNAKLPSFTFAIGDSRLTIPSEALNYGKVIKGGSICAAAIQPASDLDFSILGDTTLQSTFAVFDAAPKLGFAPKRS
ncbi:acid protease [Daldinia eschscholtzii]|nr:acid protease [Daldinia eschscholtzii]